MQLYPPPNEEVEPCGCPAVAAPDSRSSAQAIDLEAPSLRDSRNKFSGPHGLQDTLLLEVFTQADLPTLLRCRRVHPHWRSLIDSRLLFCSRQFLLPPSTAYSPRLLGLAPGQFELHPVLKKLDYWGYNMSIREPGSTPLLRERVQFFDGWGQSDPLVRDAEVSNAFCSRPATESVSIWCVGMWRRVDKKGGVTVWDLMEAFDGMIQYLRYPTTDPDAAEDVERPLVWNHNLYPFAGFRVTRMEAGKKGLVVTPEFHDTFAMTSEVRRKGWSEKKVVCFGDVSEVGG